MVATKNHPFWGGTKWSHHVSHLDPMLPPSVEQLAQWWQLSTLHHCHRNRPWWLGRFAPPSHLGSSQPKDAEKWILTICYSVFTNNSIYCLPLKYITLLMVLYDSINYYYKYISIPLTLWFFGRCSARRLEAQSQWRRPRRPWQNSGHGVWKYGLSISIIYDLWSISIWIWLNHMNPSNPMVYHCPKARNCTYHRHPTHLQVI